MNEAQAADKPDAKILYNPRSKSAEFGSMFVPPAGKRLPGMPSVLAPSRAPAQEGVAPEEAQAQAQPAPQAEPAPAQAVPEDPYAPIREIGTAIEALRGARLASLSRGRDKTFSDLEKTIGEMNDYKNRSQFERLDLSPGLAFVDSLTGSNLQKGYTAPETIEELRRKLADHQEKLLGEQNKAIDSISDSLKSSGARTPMERAISGFNKEAEKLRNIDTALMTARKLLNQNPRGVAQDTLLRTILKATGEDRISDKDLESVSRGDASWMNRLRSYGERAKYGQLTQNDLNIIRRMLDDLDYVQLYKKKASVQTYSAGSDLIYENQVDPAKLEAVLRLKVQLENSMQSGQFPAAASGVPQSAPARQVPKSQASALDNLSKAMAAKKGK